MIKIGNLDYVVGIDPYKTEEGEKTLATIVIRKGNDYLYQSSKKIDNNPEEFSKLCKEWVEDINNRVPEINTKLLKDGK